MNHLLPTPTRLEHRKPLLMIKIHLDRAAKLKRIPIHSVSQLYQSSKLHRRIHLRKSKQRNLQTHLKLRSLRRLCSVSPQQSVIRLRMTQRVTLRLIRLRMRTTRLLVRSTELVHLLDTAHLDLLVVAETRNVKKRRRQLPLPHLNLRDLNWIMKQRLAVRPQINLLQTLQKQIQMTGSQLSLITSAKIRPETLKCL